MAISAGSVFVNLGAKLDRSDFEAYDRELKKVQEKAARREAFKVQLGANYDSRAFNAYERELKRATKDTDDHIRAQGRLRTSFGSLYGRGGAVFAAAGGIAGLTVALKSVISTASDVNESLTKNRVLFGQYSKEIIEFSETSAKRFGLSREAVLQYTGTFGNLFRAFGTSQKQSAAFSVQLTKLAADMASFNNTSIEQALKAIQAGLVGQVRPLRQFGVNLSAVALQAEALATGIVHANVNQDKLKISTAALELAQLNVGKAVKAHGARSEEAKRAQLGLERAQLQVTKAAAGGKVVLDAQQKALAAMSLTEKQTRLAHGDFARTSNQLANQQRILTARLSDVREEIGVKLLPVVLKVTLALNRFIDSVQGGGKSTTRLSVEINKLIKDVHSLDGAFRVVSRTIGVVFKVAMDIAIRSIRAVRTTLEGLVAGVRATFKLIDDLLTGDFADAWKQAEKVAKNGAKVVIGVIEEMTAPIRAAARAASDALGDPFSNTFHAIVRTARGFVNDLVDVVNFPLKALGLKTIGHISSGGGGSDTTVGTRRPATTGSRGDSQTKAGGGWIGNRGQAGQDTVPAMLGVGEAVLNRHQQAVIEGILGHGFLDGLFANVTRPHYAARGGRVGFASGGFGRSQLASLWDRAGGPSNVDNLMAAIALAESGGNPQAHNPSGASGLWQILGLPFPGDPFDPLTNARMAVSKYRSQGLGAWEAYTNGSYRRFLGGGGGGIGGALRGVVGAISSAVSAPLDLLGKLKMPGIPGGLGPFGGVLGAVGSRVFDAIKSKISLGGAVHGMPGPGATVAGPAGVGSFEGVPMANWVIGALQHARSKGFSGHPTSGYRPGIDPHTATGASEHQGTRYPHGAVDFGGMSDPPAKVIKDAFVASVADYAYPLIAPIGFRDDGHASGTGHSRGGWVGFARGGRVSNRKAPKVPTTAGGARTYIRPLRAMQTDRIRDYDADLGAVDDYNTRYSILERQYNLTDEELIRDDGTVDEAAVSRRSNELASLASVRARIVDSIRHAVAVAQRVIKTYRTILARLRASLAHAKGKNRAGVRGLIATYEGRLSEWTGNLKDLTGDKLPNAKLDLAELVKERAGVLGTQADISTDTTTSDTGTTADTASTDTATAPPTALDIAAATAANFQSYLSTAASTFSGFGANFLGAPSAAGAFAGGGLASIAGARYFGATGGQDLGGSSGGPTFVIQEGGSFAHFATAPETAPTFASQMRFQIEAAVG